MRGYQKPGMPNILRHRGNVGRCLTPGVSRSNRESWKVCWQTIFPLSENWSEHETRVRVDNGNALVSHNTKLSPFSLCTVEVGIVVPSQSTEHNLQEVSFPKSI